MSRVPPHHWPTEAPPRALAWPLPTFGVALARGATNRCPACGHAGLFRGFLAVAPSCGACHAPLGAVRADDAPPYFTILLVGHIVVPLLLLSERHFAPPMLLEAAIFLPLTLLLALALLRPVKGATLGWMLRLGITGAEHD